MFDLRKIFAVPKDFLKSKIYCNAQSYKSIATASWDHNSIDLHYTFQTDIKTWQIILSNSLLVFDEFLSKNCLMNFFRRIYRPIFGRIFEECFDKFSRRVFDEFFDKFFSTNILTIFCDAFFGEFFSQNFFDYFFRVFDKLFNLL